MTKLTADTITNDQIVDIQTEALAKRNFRRSDLCMLALGYTPLIAWNMTPYGARIEIARIYNRACKGA